MTPNLVLYEAIQVVVSLYLLKCSIIYLPTLPRPDLPTSRLQTWGFPNLDPGHKCFYTGHISDYPLLYSGIKPIGLRRESGSL